MTTGQLLRVVILLLGSYLMWRTAPGWTNEIWWLMLVTGLHWLVVMGCIIYVFRKTEPMTKKYPSTVRSRLASSVREGFNGARDKKE